MPVVGAPPLSPDDLRGRREALGLSRVGVATALGISEGALRHWETGRKPIPPDRLDEIRLILDHYAAPEIGEMTGRELRALRERHSLSQQELAHLLGVTRRAIIGWEAGDVPEQRRDVLREVFAGAGSPRAGMLRALRKRAGWTQAELGEQVGASQNDVSKWERGTAEIPADQWPAIRDTLLAAEPDIRPTDFERPFTHHELHEGVERLGWTLGELAERVGVARGTIGPWATGAKPIPRERWREFREILGTGERRTPTDRAAEALAIVLDAITAEPGAARTAVIKNTAPALSEARARKAIAVAVQEGHAHERPVPRARRDGVVRYMPGLFAGPQPDHVPEVDRLELVVCAAVTSISVNPGRTRRQVATALPHDRRSGEAAIDRAIASGQVHTRAQIVETRRGWRVQLGLYAGPLDEQRAPARISGAELHDIRDQLLLGQREFAEQIGVDVSVLRRWERDEVPEPWRPVISEIAHRAREHGVARGEALRVKILNAVRDQPGVSRWGNLTRQVRQAERPLLSELLDELVERRELHERVVHGGRQGVGLFPGPPPPEWEPGPPITPDELSAMCKRAGFTQAALARRLGASTATVSAWLKGEKPVPGYRRAQIRPLIAAEEATMLDPAELRAERERAGLSQAAVGARFGVEQPTVSKWERGAVPVPVPVRKPLREFLAAAPTVPTAQVEGAELRRWRLRQGMTLDEVGAMFGVAKATIADWERVGVSRDRAVEVRRRLDAEASAAQGELFLP